jgi:endonuclease G
VKKLLFALLCLSSPAYASPCDQFFPNGKEVAVPNTTVYCNSFYATVYNPTREAALFSTEIFQGHTNKVERTNDFHADARLSNSPTPSDYDRTGFDRGHLTPAADAASDTQMHDTFLMTNMTPQEPTLNRVSWRLLESHVRDMPAKYVVTGAIYSASPKTIGKHKVLIPTSYYKLVYLTDGTIKAYIANNTPKAPVTETTLATVDTLSGIKFQ